MNAIHMTNLPCRTRLKSEMTHAVLLPFRHHRIMLLISLISAVLRAREVPQCVVW